jgi:hypothetical protein
MRINTTDLTIKQKGPRQIQMEEMYGLLVDRIPQLKT